MFFSCWFGHTVKIAAHDVSIFVGRPSIFPSLRCEIFFGKMQEKSSGSSTERDFSRKSSEWFAGSTVVWKVVIRRFSRDKGRAYHKLLESDVEGIGKQTEVPSDDKKLRIGVLRVRGGDAFLFAYYPVSCARLLVTGPNFLLVLGDLVSKSWLCVLELLYNIYDTNEARANKKIVRDTNIHE